jgi:hypothetical protein
MYILILLLLLPSCTLTCIKSRSGADTAINITVSEDTQIDPEVERKP